jgi:integrase
LNRIPLPDETLALLLRHKTAQAELQLKNGDLWQGTGYIFTQDDGKPMNPDSIIGWLSDFSKRYKLPHINPHAFRHTAASVLISQGADIITVSKMLGHAKVSATGDIYIAYSHVIEESKQQAGNTLAPAFFKKDDRAVKKK